MKRALALVIAGCGGAAAPAPAPVDNTATQTGEIDVYVWDGERLAGLYCLRASELHVDGCAFRERFDADALLVIASDAGESIWTGRSSDEPVLGTDSSGVARLAMPYLDPVGKKRVREPPPGPMFQVMGYRALGLAAIDLDRDGLAEVIYLSDDDMGIFAAAAEYDRDDGFRARVPEIDESEL